MSITDKISSVSLLSIRKDLMIRFLILLSISIGYHFTAAALPKDFYTASSRLASGKWAKVEVKEAGMQFISNTTLKNLGFSNPDKVNVYGFGGRQLSERLDASMTDDLPALPSLRTPTGIVFFGHATTSWTRLTSNQMTYRHSLNAYSDKAYYFISDVDTDRKGADAAGEVTPTADEPVTVFTERIAHEQDLSAPASTGRLLLGEDFRTQSSRNFTFSLPDNRGDAKICVAFGAKVTNGSSSLLISANGERLPSSASDKIDGTSGEQFISVKSTYKTVSDPGEKLMLGIQYSYSGAIFTAALDYIEVEYPRALRLRDNELYFYISPSKASAVKVEGCSDGTVIWDVTDPVAPKAVSFTLSGTTASFASPAGYHEFVAFNPQKINRAATPAGKVMNQDLHSLEAPGMLVIAPEAFKSAAQRLAQLHADTDGLEVVVVTPEEVYNEFSSGTPDVTAFRKLLKMWYDRARGGDKDYTKFCLLFSRPTYDNKMVTPAVKRAGYPRLPIWQSPTGTNTSTSYSTDDYIGMLNDNSKDPVMGNEIIHVAVGRMPVKSAQEADMAISKLERYIKNPTLGAWRNNVMIIADDQDHGKHLSQAEKVWEQLSRHDSGADFVYEKLYLDAYTLTHSPLGDIYPEAKQRMMDKLSEGVAYVDYIGHANSHSWSHEQLLTWTDLTSMTNKNLPFIYAATCEFMSWDEDEVSGAEEMWLNPTAGVIGMICPSRKVYVDLNGTLNANTAAYTYRLGNDGQPLRLGEMMINGKNASPGSDNKLRYGFMGDPSMRLPYPQLVAKVETINSVALDNITDMADAPQLPSRGKVVVEGIITDRTGEPAEDFNGVIDLQLYDAEKTVTTHGNGKEGEVMNYNDRSVRLFTGKTQVTGGKWSVAFSMPTEIENNYSPAFISLYASDSNGREAGGSTDKLYVYGYDFNADDDFDGPEITEFYLNSPSFSDGSVVGPSSMLYASFNDPSGINVSDAGIGHKMGITIDGDTYLDDVVLYYTSDTSSTEKGSIAYPLPSLEPGEHKLEFKVWDTANNSTSAELSFNIMAAWTPSISNLSTDVNPASTSVVFNVTVDGTLGNMPCLLEVFDLSGRKVWSNEGSNLSEGATALNVGWNLCDFSGHRVARGIYLYRATVTTSDGREISETRKLAVTAP